MKPINKAILAKLFINYFVVFILLLLFIHGVNTISHATETTYEWVFAKHNSIDSDLLKSYILEERMKGAAITVFSGIGLLLHYTFATHHFYQSLKPNRFWS